MNYSIFHFYPSFHAVYNSLTLPYYEQSNEGHGRKERRMVMQLKAKLSHELKKNWPHIKSLIKVASKRTINGVTSCSSCWYVSSLPINAEELAQVIGLLKINLH